MTVLCAILIELCLSLWNQLPNATEESVSLFLLPQYTNNCWGCLAPLNRAASGEQTSFYGGYCTLDHQCYSQFPSHCKGNWTFGSYMSCINLPEHKMKDHHALRDHFQKNGVRPSTTTWTFQPLTGSVLSGLRGETEPTTIKVSYKGNLKVWCPHTMNYWEGSFQSWAPYDEQYMFLDINLLTSDVVYPLKTIHRSATVWFVNSDPYETLTVQVTFE